MHTQRLVLIVCFSRSYVACWMTQMPGPLCDWASKAINFPTFDCKMQGFGARYISSDWNPICNHVFDLSEDGNIAAATTYIAEQIKSHGLLSPPATVKTKGKHKAESSEQDLRCRKWTQKMVCFLFQLTCFFGSRKLCIGQSFPGHRSAGR